MEPIASPPFNASRLLLNPSPVTFAIPWLVLVGASVVIAIWIVWCPPHRLCGKREDFTPV